jgi:hypothetical protein
MGFERLVPQPAAHHEVTSGDDVLCGQKGCSKPATGYVTFNVEGPGSGEATGLQLTVPIRLPMCDEHRGMVAGETTA